MSLVARILALLLAAGTAFAAPQMVTPVPRVAAKSTPANGLPSSAVRFNGDELFALEPGAEVELTLPSGKRHSYIYEHTVSHGGGISTWIARGALGGDRERAIVTSGPGGSWGWMKTPHGEFRIYPGEGNDWLAERPSMNFAPRAGGSDGIVAPPDDASVVPFKGVPTLASPLTMQKSFVLTKAVPAPAFQADVMIIYSKDIATKLGAGLMPMIYNLIASANQAYVDSQVALSLRLVYSMELDLPNSAGSSDTLDSMGNVCFPPTRPCTNAALFAPYTWQTGSVRNTVGADFVAVVRDGPNDTGGIAFILKNPTIYPSGPSATNTAAYSVNNYCAVGCEEIFAHELGHNMGNAHDRATVAYDEGGTVPLADGVFSYSYGHYFCTNGLNCNPFSSNGALTCTTHAQCLNRQTADFGTVMAYVSPRVMKFSNPGIACPSSPGGQPCGLANQDDNARSMNEVRHNIAAYRNQTITALPGSLQFTRSGYSATEAGGTLTFTVSRSGGSSGAVTANYAVASGSATSGTDFTAASGTLSWANGETADKSINVTLISDALNEGPESLIATLSAPAGATGVHLGHPASTVGLIVEPWPIGGTMPAGFTTSANPAVVWAVATDQVFEGTNSLRSAQVFGNGDFSTYVNSDLTYAGTLPAGPVAFAYKVSSYQGYGYFEFIVDGVTILSATGEDGWSLFSYNLPTAGAHTLVWRYKSRLPSACNGGWNPPPEGGALCADRAWIDALSLPAAQSATQFALTVSKSGTGTVASSPAGIDCGATCAANFDSGTPVTLTAVAGAGSAFSGWAGGGCSGTGTCMVTMSGAAAVTANFTALTAYAVAISGAQEVPPTAATGSGSGTATVNPAANTITYSFSVSGLSGSLIGAHFHGPAARGVDGGVKIDIGAIPFSGTVSYSEADEAAILGGQWYVNYHTAAFPGGELRGQLDNLSVFLLSVSKTGTGTGTVTSAPAGIDCGSDCSEMLAAAATVTLTATPAAGSVFAGWSGGGCSGTGTCFVTMNAATGVTATFTATVATNPPRLGNISTRGQVLTGDNVMIGGFIIGGATAKTVLVRARGPSMIPAGVLNAMANPQLTLVAQSTATIIGTNDNWGDALNASAITATGKAPTNVFESAILLNLNPGAYTAVVSGVGGTTGVGIIEVFEIDGPTIPLTNISTRGRVLTGDDVMIGGFIIDGDAPKTVLIRARGPSMIPAGVTDALPNPQMTLVNQATAAIIGTNDNWGDATNAASITATGLAPTSALESAILITLQPGAYTVVVSGVGGATGVGIVEVFAQ